MSEWISVEEYLPPFNKRVLVFFKNFDELVSEFPIAVGYLDDTGDIVFDSSDYIVDATHWMKLPDPPETV